MLLAFNTLTASLRLAVMPCLQLVQAGIASVTVEPASREVVCRSMTVSTSICCNKIRATYVVYDVDCENCNQFVQRTPIMVHDVDSESYHFSGF